MEKIVLSELEKDLIERYLRDEIGYYAKEGESVALVSPMYTKEEGECWDKLLDKACALEDELNAGDEVMKVHACSVILWYWLKYLEQEKEA